MKLLLFRYAWLLAALTVGVSANGQKKKGSRQADQREWLQGTVTTEDGKTLTGLVKYNLDGFINFKDGAGAHVYAPTNAAGFSFTDTKFPKERKFYTIYYVDPDTGIEAPKFFELLGEFRGIALLSRIDRVDERGRYDPLLPPIESAGGTSTPTDALYQKVSFELWETIFVMTADGDIKPYLSIEERDINFRNYEIFIPDRTKVKSKIVDKDLLPRLTGPHYTALEKYADDNDLKFRIKEDLLKIMAHYAGLE